MVKKFYLELIRERYAEATVLFIKTIAHRVFKYNKNALIITCGASGSGKSYVDLELMRGIYAYCNGEYPTDEYVVERCFFKLNTFLKILNSEEIQNPKTSKGQMFISEEVGTQASNRTHQNIANRAYSFIVQTFRAKGMILFFNVPSFNFIDSQVRKQLHYLIETKMIDTKRKACIIKTLELQYNSRMDKLYTHNLICRTEKNEILELDLISIPKIPKSLELIYEKYKSDFINDLNRELQNSLMKYEDKQIEAYVPTQGRKLLSENQQLYWDKYIEIFNEKGNYKGIKTDVANALNIKLPSGTKIRQAMEQKGYFLPTKKEEIPKIEENPLENVAFHQITATKPQTNLNFVPSD